MKCLVTGASGFLGSFFRYYYMEYFPGHEIIWGSSNSANDSDVFTIFSKKYSDVNYVLKNQNVECIIHMASVIPDNFSSASYKNILLPNLEMNEYLYQYALRNKIKKFINISSFGSMENPEDYDVKDYYTLSKVIGDHYVSMLNHNGVSACSLRISSPYGEFMYRNNVIKIFVNKALKNEDICVFGTGKREQNFVYAGDIIDAIALSVKNNGKGLYNICGKKVSMLELAELIKDITGTNSKIIVGKNSDPQEKFRVNYNSHKANSEIGFDPRFSLYDGIKRYLEWLKNENSNNI